MAKNKDVKTNIWLPLFVAIGCIIGAILSISTNDYIYLASGLSIGILLGVVLWATAIHVEKRKNKKND